MKNKSPFGLGSSNGATQLITPQSLVMKKNVCHEDESPFKQHLEMKFTPKSKEKQPPSKLKDLLNTFGMKLIVNTNEKESELIQELDMQDVKNTCMRELTSFDPYTIFFY